MVALRPNFGVVEEEVAALEVRSGRPRLAGR